MRHVVDRNRLGGGEIGISNLSLNQSEVSTYTNANRSILPKGNLPIYRINPTISNKYSYSQGIRFLENTSSKVDYSSLDISMPYSEIGYMIIPISINNDFYLRDIVYMGEFFMYLLWNGLYEEDPLTDITSFSSHKNIIQCVYSNVAGLVVLSEDGSLHRIETSGYEKITITPPEFIFGIFELADNIYAICSNSVYVLQRDFLGWVKKGTHRMLLSGRITVLSRKQGEIYVLVNKRNLWILTLSSTGVTACDLLFSNTLEDFLPWIYSNTSCMALASRHGVYIGNPTDFGRPRNYTYKDGPIPEEYDVSILSDYSKDNQYICKIYISNGDVISISKFGEPSGRTKIFAENPIIKATNYNYYPDQNITLDPIRYFIGVRKDMRICWSGDIGNSWTTVIPDNYPPNIVTYGYTPPEAIAFQPSSSDYTDGIALGKYESIPLYLRISDSHQIEAIAASPRYSL